MKKLFPKIIGLLTVVSMIVGLVNDIPGLIKFAKGDSGNRFSILLSIINNLITDVYALIILGLLFLIALFWLALRRNAKVRGTHGIPVRISVFLRRINPSMIRMIIFAIHNFQHQMTNIIEGLCAKNETRDDIFSDKVKRQTGLLLAEAQKTIQIALRNEISIHIKLFSRLDQSDQDGETKPDETFLRTYERIPSRSEKVKNERGELPWRAYDERFKILEGGSGGPVSLRGEFTKGEDSHGFSVNSAYNYILGKNEHYWMSNDLKIDEKRENFYSTSRNYDRYYRSLAVFLICPPLKPGRVVDKTKPMGILVVDSMATKIFERIFIAQLIGYFAHRFYEYFSAFLTERIESR